jgi:hypothetical protein
VNSTDSDNSSVIGGNGYKTALVLFSRIKLKSEDISSVEIYPRLGNERFKMIIEAP